MAKSKWVLYFSIILFLLAIAQIIRGLTLNVSFVDFYAYYGAVKDYVEGVSPYLKEYPNPLGVLNFIYPPGALSILSIFAYFSASTGIIIVTILSLVAFIASILLTFRLLSEKVPIAYQLIITALLLQTFPMKFTLTLGQVNTWALFFMIASLYFLKHKKETFSSLSLVISATIKLIPLGLLPLFIFRSRWRWLVLVVIFFILFNWQNPTLFQGFFVDTLPKFFGESTRAIVSLDTYNQSLQVALERSFGAPTNPLFALTISGTLYVLIVYAGRKDPIYLNALPILALLSISSRMAEQHHLVFIYPFIIYYFRKPLHFFIIWVILVLHTDSGNPIIQTFPFVASYHTILILTLIFVYLYKKLRSGFQLRNVQLKA